MTGLSLALAHAVKLAVLAALVGVLARGRVPQSWVIIQASFDLLKLLLVLELAWRAFSVFPGALRRARLVLSMLLGASSVAMAVFTPPSSYATVWDFQPSVVTGTLWLLTATALMVVWYQIPVHDWQRAIMLGLAPYLLVFVAALDILRRHGWSAAGSASLLDQGAYLALIVFWAWAAWRRDPAPAIVAGAA
jgi:hypothetical protein